jgi:pimeloyl-ACP methyl ester carboxylesterase
MEVHQLPTEGDVPTESARTDSGSTLVFVPGTMCPPQIFDDVSRFLGVRALGLGWLEVDGPCDIESSARRVLDVCRDEAPVILVGHSTGGVISALATVLDSVEATKVISGLLIANSGPNTVGHGDIGSMITRLQKEWGEPGLVEDFARRCLTEPIASDDFELLRSYPARLSRDRVVEALVSQSELDLSSRLPDIGVPTVVVHGRRDSVRSRTHSTAFRSGIRGSHLVELSTGHMSSMEDSRGFARAIRSLSDEVRRNVNQTRKRL